MAGGQRGFTLVDVIIAVFILMLLLTLGPCEH